MSELIEKEIETIQSIHGSLGPSAAEIVDAAVVSFYTDARAKRLQFVRQTTVPVAVSLAPDLATNLAPEKSFSTAKPMMTDPGGGDCLDESPEEEQDADDECADEGGSYDLENCECYGGPTGGGGVTACSGSAPTGETVSSTKQDPTYDTVTDFYMTLTGGSGSFSGWTVEEYMTQQGVDGCWNSNPSLNQAYVPEYLDPTSGGSSWPVNNSNGYGPDLVGWTPGSVNYIRNNSPLYSNTPLITTFPCGGEVYQALTAACSATATPYLYVPQQEQSETIYSSYVQNCRPIGTCSVLDH